MNNWLNKIHIKFQSGNILEKIIYINIIVFLLTFLFNSLSFLLVNDSNFIINWFALSPHFDAALLKPWTLISYGFLHHGFLHILFNLILLFYVGNIFLDFFSQRQFLTYYLLGIITGGVIYMLSYNYFPALKTQESYLVGASAGVTAILIGISSLIPNYSIRFRFIGNIKLLYIAIAFIALDIIQIPNGNAGGHLAHLGGALVGFLLTTNFNQGKNSIKWYEVFFKPKEKNPLKTVYKQKQTSSSKEKRSGNDQKRIDEILDKISKSGYETLTKEEKDFLFKIGKN